MFNFSEIISSKKRILYFVISAIAFIFIMPAKTGGKELQAESLITRGDIYYHKPCEIAKGSIITRQSSNKIAVMRAKLETETEKQKKESEILKKDNAIKDLQLKKYQTTKRIYASGFFLFLFIILCILLMYRMKIKSVKQLELALQNNRHEIEELKKIEKEKDEIQSQIILSQKMESMGRLAGGIAHEFNNLLTGIMGYADMLKMKYNDTNQFEGKAADIIYRGSLAAQELTKGLLGFSMRGKYNPTSLNLNDSIKEVVEKSGKILTENIKLNFDLDDGIQVVKADKSQFSQVLANLILNARDAMPEGGEITFKTENVNIGEVNNGLFPEIIKPGHYVILSVSDTGIGMSQEIIDRIFDPFFTTKEVGKGTGLGLAGAYGIVKNHGGYIFCNSEPGKGATFSIYLPHLKREIRIEEKFKKKAGRETILVVDDEDIVLYSSRDMLSRLGYEVLLASSGDEAIEIYKKNKNGIDLVMLDAIMPEKTGEETFKYLKEIDSHIKVLLMSGYSKYDIMNETLEKDTLGFLKKPFDMNNLSALVSKALNPSSAADK